MTTLKEVVDLAMARTPHKSVPSWDDVVKGQITEAIEALEKAMNERDPIKHLKIAKKAIKAAIAIEEAV